jgi:hypothetical protein
VAKVELTFDAVDILAKNVAENDFYYKADSFIWGTR